MKQNKPHVTVTCVNATCMDEQIQQMVLIGSYSLGYILDYGANYII